MNIRLWAISASIWIKDPIGTVLSLDYICVFVKGQISWISRICEQQHYLFLVVGCGSALVPVWSSLSHSPNVCSSRYFLKYVEFFGLTFWISAGDVLFVRIRYFSIAFLRKSKLFVNYFRHCYLIVDISNRSFYFSQWDACWNQSARARSRRGGAWSWRPDQSV